MVLWFELMSIPLIAQLEMVQHFFHNFSVFLTITCWHFGIVGGTFCAGYDLEELSKLDIDEIDLQHGPMVCGSLTQISS